MLKPTWADASVQKHPKTLVAEYFTQLKSSPSAKKTAKPEVKVKDMAYHEKNKKHTVLVDV